MKNFARLLTAVMLLAIASGPGRAQDAYPSRPVKIMIAFPVGGLLDTVSRIVGEKLSGLLGQQFLVEARPGAGGTLATAAVAKADPDGYTLMMINDNHALNPSVFRNIPYDSVKDFAPVGFVGYTPLILVANAALPMRSAKDLVEAAKQKPGTITYGSVGVGSASHLAGVMLESAAGIQWQHVPYRGGAPALNDLVAGHVNTMFMSPVVSLPHMQTGKLTGLALAAPTRLEILPDLTTMAEAGYPVDASYWFGLVAPAGTPPAVLARLEKALADVLAMPDVRKRLTDMGAIVRPLNGKQFGDYIGAEIVKWGDLVKKAGVKPE
ncbi:MAG: tripartite tricarboxylate transporter substrate binding protein [Xanthobacteraceae bacterium]|nr:tripartite tricarboxylate transporter substrate binding protein [Xanthobacteraceae bacterium]